MRKRYPRSSGLATPPNIRSTSASSGRNTGFHGVDQRSLCRRDDALLGGRERRWTEVTLKVASPDPKSGTSSLDVRVVHLFGPVCTCQWNDGVPSKRAMSNRSILLRTWSAMYVFDGHRKSTRTASCSGSAVSYRFGHPSNTTETVLVLLYNSFSLLDGSRYLSPERAVR